MTDRVQAITVLLDKDMRTDDVEKVVQAICMVRHVATATAEHITNPEDWFARQRVRSEMAQQIFDVYRAVCDGRKISIEPKKP